MKSHLSPARPSRFSSAVTLVSLAGFAAAAQGVVVERAINVRLDSASVDAGANPPVLANYNLDITLDGTNDFSFTHTHNTVQDIPKTDQNGKLTLTAATAGQFLKIVKDTDNTNGLTSNPVANYAETVPAGSIVGPSSTFVSLEDASYDSRLLDSSGDGDGGAFSIATGERPPVSTGDAYLGFAFGNSANPNYGYIRFSTIDDDSGSFLGLNDDSNGATIASVVYETVAGTPIVAPEPTSFAILGLGAAALLRRQRPAATLRA